MRQSFPGVDPAPRIHYRSPRCSTNHEEPSMGKGDKRTRKGKTFKHSYGKTRPHKTAKKAPAKKAR